MLIENHEELMKYLMEEKDTKPKSEKQINRQKIIEKELECTFLRIKDRGRR